MRLVVFAVCVLVLLAPMWVKSADGEPYLHYTHYRHPPNVALAYVGMLGLADAGTRHGNKTLQRWQDADGNWHYSDVANAVAGSEAVSAADLGATNFVRRDGKDKGSYIAVGYAIAGLALAGLLWGLPSLLRLVAGARLPQRAVRDTRDPSRPIDYVPPGD